MGEFHIFLPQDENVHIVLSADKLSFDNCMRLDFFTVEYFSSEIVAFVHSLDGVTKRIIKRHQQDRKRSERISQ